MCHGQWAPLPVLQDSPNLAQPRGLRADARPGWGLQKLFQDAFPSHKRCIKAGMTHTRWTHLQTNHRFGFYTIGSFTTHLRATSWIFLYCLKLHFYRLTAYNSITAQNHAYERLVRIGTPLITCTSTQNKQHPVCFVLGERGETLQKHISIVTNI